MRTAVIRIRRPSLRRGLGQTGIYRGAWNAITTYNPGDEVSDFLGNYWLATATNTNQQPGANPQSWRAVSIAASPGPAAAAAAVSAQPIVPVSPTQVYSPATTAQPTAPGSGPSSSTMAALNAALGAALSAGILTSANVAEIQSQAINMTDSAVQSLTAQINSMLPSTSTGSASSTSWFSGSTTLFGYTIGNTWLALGGLGVLVLGYFATRKK